MRKNDRMFKNIWILSAALATLALGALPPSLRAVLAASQDHRFNVIKIEASGPGNPLDHALPEALMARYGTQDIAAAVEAFSRELGSTTDRLKILSSWIADVDGRDARTLAYIVAGSYVRFLVEAMFDGDSHTFPELYRSGDYRSALGISADESWDRWVKTLRPRL